MNYRDDPEPDDEHDPRVLLEWEDMLGQTIRVGDYVAIRWPKRLTVGKVTLIQALRKNGQPYRNKKPTIHVHLCGTPNPPSMWAIQPGGLDRELLWRDRQGVWNPIALKYDPNPDPTQLPIIDQVRDPTFDVIKIDWKTNSEREAERDN